MREGALLCILSEIHFEKQPDCKAVKAVKLFQAFQSEVCIITANNDKPVICGGTCTVLSLYSSLM